MNHYQDHQYLEPILRFLDEINLPYQLQPINGKMFLPGIMIRKGTIIIDKEKLKFPGDILHEAGHIAVAPADVRSKLTSPVNAQLDFDAATHEMMTLAWSYAAALESGTPLDVLFHAEGYKGQGDNISYGFQSGQYIGLPMLQYLGMACDANHAAKNNTQPFPAMIHWLRPKLD